MLARLVVASLSLPPLNALTLPSGSPSDGHTRPLGATANFYGAERVIRPDVADAGRAYVSDALGEA